MKFIHRMIILLLCLCAATFAWASYAKKKVANNNQLTVAVTGIHGKALENIKMRLGLKEKILFINQPDEAKWRFYHGIPSEIKTALQPYGYFKPIIHSSLTKQGQQWLASIVVQPGPRMHFDQVSIELQGGGTQDHVFKNYLKHTPIKSGDNFNSTYYQQILDALQGIASARGYFKAQFIRHELAIDLRNYTSQVKIVFDTGPRFRFGDTLFSPSPIKQSLLRRYLEYSPGTYYRASLVEKSRLNLSGSDFFQQVMLTPDISQAEGTDVPIIAQIHPQDQVTYSFGAGYGTDTGVRGLASVDVHWLNSHGHSFKANLRGSQNNSQLAGEYIIPAFSPYKDFFTITAGLMTMSQITGNGKNAQAGVTYQTIFYNWHLNVSLNFLTERYSLQGYPSPNQSILTNANMLFPRLTLQKTQAKKSLLSPTKGYSINFSLATASKSLGSKTSMTQYRLDTKFLYTMPTHTRLLLRLTAGGTSIPNLENLPLSMQFFAGGAASIRGFQFNSIGPGRYIAVGSFEVQQRLIGKFYLCGFIDAGNVTDTLFKSRLRVGTGPGVMYLSPVGPIEIDIAQAVSDTGHKPWTIQFSMGSAL